MEKNPPFIVNVEAKPAITFNKVWPAIIFAKRRTARLMGLNMYEINSIGINKKASAKLVPAGKNKVKNFKPFFFTLIIFIPIKKEQLKVNVITNWLVNV